MILRDGKLLPGECIGEYSLGMTEECVVALLDSKYTRLDRENGSCVISVENAKFWFDPNKKLTQIGVTTGFVSKYKDRIGIGNTLTDIRNMIGECYREYDDYLIKGVKGIAFELSDIDSYDDEWDELTAPIEWIFIYKS